MGLRRQYTRAPFSVAAWRTAVNALDVRVRVPFILVMEIKSRNGNQEQQYEMATHRRTQRRHRVVT